MKHLSAFAIILCLLSSCSSPKPVEISLVPYPTQIETGNGRFRLSSNTQLIVQDQGEFSEEVAFFQSMMQQAIGQNLSDVNGENILEIQKAKVSEYPESYHLKITSDKVTLEAGDADGKEVVVWDDAMAGGIDSKLTVMYWRNWVAEVPDKVVQNGNDIILTPGDHFYFSTPNSKLFDIYNKPLLGSKFPVELKHKIKGIQACLWTETIPSEELADAMLFPNVLALAERAWSTQESQEWNSFKARLKNQLSHLDQLGVKY